MQIDTEGYDYNIIKVFPFHIVKPQIIQYEICALTKSGQKDCIKLLSNNGYVVIEKESDAIAFLKSKKYKYLVFIFWLYKIYINYAKDKT